MTEKNLIKQLNNLKNVNPEAAWLKSNRELFLTQINNAGTNKLTFWEVFYINIKSFTKASAQPVFALGIFLVVLVGSSIFSHKLFSEAKPNDSLYIARVISEKAKLSTVMDTTERDRMAVKFATNHAKDITVVLANPEFNNEENQDQVARLNENFSKEIETVKTRMVSLTAADKAREVREAARNINSGNQSGTSTEVTATNTPEEIVSIATEDGFIEDNGIQISEVVPVPAVEEVPVVLEIVTPVDPVQEVKDLFERKEYDTVINKLQEVSESIKRK